MKILLVLTLLFFQVSSVASANSPTLFQVFSVALQDHHHESKIDHESERDESAQSHEHKHRHSPGEPEHSHSHNHLAGQMHATCLIGSAAFNLNFSLDANLAFLSFDKKAAQSPFLSSVFRPPIA